MLPMFNKLANVITKHYKLVLVAWIVVLLVSIPAMMRVNEVINYESTGVTEGDYESIQASEIISSEFQGSVANSTLIIVLQADDVTDANSRNYVLALQNGVLSSTDMKGFTGITTPYTIEQMILNQTVLALGPTMRPAEQQVSSSAFLLYGIPALHVSNWMTSSSDSDAFNATQPQLLAYLAQQGANESEVQLSIRLLLCLRRRLERHRRRPGPGGGPYGPGRPMHQCRGPDIHLQPALASGAAAGHDGGPGLLRPHQLRQRDGGAWLHPEHDQPGLHHREHDLPAGGLRPRPEL